MTQGFVWRQREMTENENRSKNNGKHGFSSMSLSTDFRSIRLSTSSTRYFVQKLCCCVCLNVIARDLEFVSGPCNRCRMFLTSLRSQKKHWSARYGYADDRAVREKARERLTDFFFFTVDNQTAPITRP